MNYIDIFTDETDQDQQYLTELLYILVTHPGILIDPKKIMRKRSLSPTKVNELILRLEEKYKLGKIIKPFSDPRIKDDIVTYSKFYFYNNNLLAGIDFRPDQEGALLEQFFFQKIKNNNLEIYYFRTKKGVEIDFVIKEFNGKIYLFEIKKDQFIYSHDLLPLLYLKDQLQDSNLLSFILHYGIRDQIDSGVRVAPIEKIILELGLSI
jgi:predicted AAA+ superfamily ATPase